MFFLVLAFWAVGVMVAFINGNRRLPMIILVLGLVVVMATFIGLPTYFGLVALAFLAIIIWVRNKADMI